MQLKDAVVGLLVECMDTNRTNVQGELIKITPHCVYVKFPTPIVPCQLKGCGYRLRYIWSFGDGCQSTLSSIHHYNPPNPNKSRVTDDIVHAVNGAYAVGNNIINNI